MDLLTYLLTLLRGLVTMLTCRCSGLTAQYWTRDRQGAGSTLARFTASNREQVPDLLCAQANSASYRQRDGNGNE